MKATVLILSKTKMNNNQVCVGGLTLRGRYVRLLDENGNNQPENTELSPKQAWEIEFEERVDNRSPHIEDIIVINRTRRGQLKDEITIKDFIEKRNIPIWRGHPNELFDKLIKWTNSGSGYIDEEGGIPNHSVGFWVSDKDLTRYDYKGVRYKYPQGVVWRSIKFKGTDQDPVNVIPAGTLIRVSLARWIAFEGENIEKCWLQLSGWYDLGKASEIIEDDLPF